MDFSAKQAMKVVVVLVCAVAVIAASITTTNKNNNITLEKSEDAIALVPNKNLISPTDSLLIHRGLGNEYIGYSIEEYILPYLNTEQKISVSADVKLSEPGKLLFYTLGRYYIDGYRIKEYKFNDTKWHRVKIEGTTVRYNPNELNGERCILSFYCNYDSEIIPTVRNIKIEEGSRATPYVE